MSAGTREPLAEVAAIASGFLDGVNVASIALMAVVTVPLTLASVAS